MRTRRAPSPPPGWRLGWQRLRRSLLRGLLRRIPADADGVARVGRRRIFILPTASGLRFAAVLFVMLLGSLNYQNNLGLLFTFFLASVALVAMHHTWFNLLGLGVRVRGGAPVFAGDDAVFEVLIENPGRRSRYDLVLSCAARRLDGVAVAGGDVGTLRIAVAAPRRGLLALDDIQLETRYPLHLFRAWCHIMTTATTLIYPKPSAFAPVPRAAAGDTEPRRQQGVEGMEDYLGPRGYRDGDSPKQIDWKVFARERGLFVKQFGGYEGQEVWIDWRALRVTDPEERISLLARQLLDAAEAGVRYGLRLPGVQESPGRGDLHLQQCLTHLALYEPDDDAIDPTIRAA
ncbi:DUF58 domain-containing protein [Thiocapsa imhoffii]|uniref:DUF58 domain-containing protein n=1 Tax=Thiocapsa imhoffii TaxID=382777 RepID=A0A9X0WEJ9_9GAMM|nr:DUF58 domain-containing protein [Thiocapsa imhoffii]MBK1643090.1 DUF58 domain-containing protein [Thiocapsa imhoffii]